MPRVKSKNLFNFRPSGVIDDDILEMEAKMEKEMEKEEVAQMVTKMKIRI